MMIAYEDLVISTLLNGSPKKNMRAFEASSPLKGSGEVPPSVLMGTLWKNGGGGWWGFWLAQYGGRFFCWCPINTRNWTKKYDLEKVARYRYLEV